MRNSTIPIVLISIGAGVAFYAVCDADVLLFAFASILAVCGRHELLAEARSNQSSKSTHR